MIKINASPLYRRHRFPPDVIAQAVWLYFRFPLSLRMVEDLLSERGITVSHQTVRTWAEKFGRHFAADIRRAARNIGCGARSIRTGLFWTFWSKVAGTRRQPSG
jgi:putative transposase